MQHKFTEAELEHFISSAEAKPLQHTDYANHSRVYVLSREGIVIKQMSCRGTNVNVATHNPYERYRPTVQQIYELTQPIRDEFQKPFQDAPFEIITGFVAGVNHDYLISTFVNDVVRSPVVTLCGDKILLQLIETCALLDGMGILHHDITPSNYKIRTNGQGILFDFEEARPSLLSTHTNPALITFGFDIDQSTSRTSVLNFDNAIINYIAPLLIEANISTLLCNNPQAKRVIKFVLEHQETYSYFVKQKVADSSIQNLLDHRAAYAREISKDETLLRNYLLRLDSYWISAYLAWYTRLLQLHSPIANEAMKSFTVQVLQRQVLLQGTILYSGLKKNNASQTKKDISGRRTLSGAVSQKKMCA